jgi:hypothetical protein
MKIRVLLPALLALAFPLAAPAAETDVVLGVPLPATLRNTSDAAANAWLSSNNAFAAEASFSAHAATSALTHVNRDPVVLVRSETGFPLERTVPEYYLGDAIDPPPDVDWPATYAAFTNSSRTAEYLFDTAGERVFPAVGGTRIFDWVLADGSTLRMSYTVSPSCSGRPRRIYWTDSPWNAPAIDLSGKFVRFFGNPAILNPTYGSATNTVGGIVQVVTNQILSGLHLDSSTHLLSAHGQLQGQVLMAYYDTGNFERILHVQVVEVCRPVVNRLAGEIGRAIQPDGRGYDTTGLRARPTVVDPSDGRGEYLYQHKGDHSYSPKNNFVYPLRPTVDCPWNAEVYWMETDEMEVEWPFELDQYSCDWPKDTTVFVRGDLDGDTGRPIYVPYGLEPTVMEYQEPDGHARAIGSDGKFVTTGEGYSLLKLAANDNIWFFPIHSVFRSDTNYFTLASSDIRVGAELLFRDGAASGTAEGFFPEIDATSPGYIYPAASGTHYNPDLYKAPAPDSRRGSGATNQVDTTSTDTNEYDSVVYAVRADGDGGKGLEVWWNTVLKEPDMPEALVVPTLPQVYSVRWPEDGECPGIVIASGLGSASESVFSHNLGLLLAATHATAELPARRYFDPSDGGTLMFWFKVSEGTAKDEAATVTLAERGGENVTNYLRLVVERSGSGVQIRHAGPTSGGSWSGLPDDGKWHHAAFAIATNSYSFFFDGALRSEHPFDSLSPLLRAAVTPVLGSTAFNSYGLKSYLASDGVTLGEILFWNKALSAEEIASEMHKTHEGPANHLTGCFSFLDGTDLVPAATGERTFTEKVLGTPCTAAGVLADRNGPLARGTGLIEPDEGTASRIYVQNGPSATGWNPNEEHAILTSSGGGRVAWAFRCDLNAENTSRPGVLVEYVKDGRKTMQWFDVVATNAIYPELAGNCTAGLQFPGPHPIDLVSDPWCPSNYWDEALDESPAFRDRKNQLWARADGISTLHLYYRNQEGFAYPSIADTNAWPKVGDEIPWLSLLEGDPDANPISAKPHPWVWRISWPETVPEMEIGRTLTTAASGLPEVWNAKSMAVVWPEDGDARNQTALLFDPTVAQTAGFEDYDTVTEVVKAMGIQAGKGGHATLRKGKWTFDNLPPNLTKRFYLDTTRPVDSCLVLVGEKENKSSGVNLLHVNVLSESERDTLLHAVDDTAEDKTAIQRWQDAIRELATDTVLPSEHELVPGKDNESKVAYIPRDHYALFSMGRPGYVTLIENDAPRMIQTSSTDTNLVASGVQPGDPISMHVIQVVPKYYTGSIVTRTDEYNLLSQQLSILYSEAFAGRPDDYEFEWRKARPESDGHMPLDFEDPATYSAKFPVTNGLTRFVVGGEGDTLDNMVNTYYTVRYRAASPESPSYAAMHDQWSDWVSPPALAEGWVQRVLNSVTPFYQRMRDLWNNEAETAVSMIVEAGAPYEGDVALSQDNLTSVGLIQLYETLLSKAESMSLLQKIDDPDANKQLQLAVGRLADMYGVLGDEAWTDALNPTISFGANFDSLAMTGFELDYGALSSALFAFDNQVPTLLDEELALLRGRTGENAPVLTASPYYNRLIWNFTRGITAGEVAYAVNYDISGTAAGTIDAEQAAKMYPQGHGDAYGHYLSALSAYYRLLRNPYFSWGKPAMGELVVADSVVNADEYDEAHFASVAYDVAKVAAEAVDRTARKAYRDNGGATGAGYLDEDPTRNFGYGEWAARGGYGALCNWAVANSLLPEEPDAGKYVRFAFTNDSTLVFAEIPESARPDLSADDPWTIEFQLVPSDPVLAETAADPLDFLGISGETAEIGFYLSSANELSVFLQPLKGTNVTCRGACYLYTNATTPEDWDDANYSTILWTNDNGTLALECGFLGDGAPSAFPTNWVFTNLLSPPEFEGWVNAFVDDAGNPSPYEYETPVAVPVPDGEPFVQPIATLPSGESSLVALVSDGTNATATVLAADGAVVARVPIPFALDLPVASIAGMGGGYLGEIGEFRVWEGVARTPEQLHEKREYVAPATEGLALYLRTVAPRKTYAIADESAPDVSWSLWGGGWVSQHESGMSIAFEDEGLTRIDRGSVQELQSLAAVVPRIQRTLDRLDAGMNPLGLANGAIPFDLSPVSDGDDARSHYEQIRERAGTALANARRLLDRAQTAGNRLRLLQEAQTHRQDLMESTELDYKNQLITYFGYPYAGDIGPSGTYPQGYDGPDLVHYAWMDLADFGISSVDDCIATNTFTLTGATAKHAWAQNLLDFTGIEKTNNFTFQLSANGLIVKPDSVTGKRRAQGLIQEALADFLCAYSSFERALEDYDYAYEQLEYDCNIVKEELTLSTVLRAFRLSKLTTEAILDASDCATQCTVNTLECAVKTGAQIAEGVHKSIPKISGAGMTVNVDPQAIAGAATYPAEVSAQTTLHASILAAKNALASFDAVRTGLDLTEEGLEIASDTFADIDGWYCRLRDASDAQYEAMRDVGGAFKALQIAQAAVETVIAEAERILDERLLVRQQAVDVLTKARYNEMFFRLDRNAALTRYSTAFELAQKYVYLAAQAYDYETGLLASDPASGERFIARIVGARTLGEFDDDGNPIETSDGVKGDGGLASILAELDANWLVLKPRLGINNPQNYATWFSLRKELFRIYGDERGDEAWRNKLSQYWVDDLNTLREFKHWCQPLAGSSAQAEPGLVIPFPSTIAFGYNFFGNETVGGDSALDPTYFATHIASAGVHFVGYDDSVLAKTPAVYLVPAGQDRMRAVGDPETVLSWNVVDQVIPAPYAIGATEIDDPDWTPLANGYTGAGDLGAKIRKHPSFRAYYGDGKAEPGDDSLDCTRLVGRSAWNTKWLLIIPAGSLAADRETALATFVNGIDADRDGTPETPGVSDILLGLKTYSTSGN